MNETLHRQRVSLIQGAAKPVEAREISIILSYLQLLGREVYCGNDVSLIQDGRYRVYITFPDAARARPFTLEARRTLDMFGYQKEVTVERVKGEWLVR